MTCVQSDWEIDQFVLSPDIIPSGWLGSKHQLINSLSLFLSLCLSPLYVLTWKHIFKSVKTGDLKKKNLRKAVNRCFARRNWDVITGGLTEFRQRKLPNFKVDGIHFCTHKAYRT